MFVPMTNAFRSILNQTGQQDAFPLRIQVISAQNAILRDVVIDTAEEARFHEDAYIASMIVAQAHSLRIYPSCKDETPIGGLKRWVKMLAAYKHADREQLIAPDVVSRSGRSNYAVT